MDDKVFDEMFSEFEEIYPLDRCITAFKGAGMPRLYVFIYQELRGIRVALETIAQKKK